MCKIKLDLQGPHGNVFYLIGITNDFPMKNGSDRKTVIKEILGGDYQNVLSIIKREWGAYIDFSNSIGLEDDEES
jgi:hypothetical protein